MKYYTKEQETINYLSTLAQHMQKVPDKTYSEQEIKTFYEKWLNEKIEERQLHLGIIDNNSTKGYYNFDADIARKKYEKEYLLRLSFISDIYPKWLLEKVDSKMLALDLVPQTVYDYIVKNNLFLESEDENVISEKNLANFPEKLHDFCEEYFFSSELLELSQNGNDLKLLLARDDDWEDGRCYIQMDFKNCNVLYQDDAIQTYPYQVQNDLFSEVYLLCYEIYQKKESMEDLDYEVHFLISDIYGDLQYLTISCKDINIDWNVSTESIHIPKCQKIM